MRDNSKKVFNWENWFQFVELERSLFQDFKHTKKVKQPGEPVEYEFSFENLAKEQILNFVLRPKNCNVTNVHLELNNYKKIKLLMTIKKGQILKYKWTDEAVL